jgi:hypothetical protein
VILFQNGKEITRRPAADNRGKLIKFFFSEVKDLKKTGKKNYFRLFPEWILVIIMAYLHRVSIK